MGAVLTAEDLLPLVAKLPHSGRVRLAKLVLRAAAAGDHDAAAYRSSPPRAGEFAGEDASLGCDAEG